DDERIATVEHRAHGLLLQRPQGLEAPVPLDHPLESVQRPRRAWHHATHLISLFLFLVLFVFFVANFVEHAPPRRRHPPRGVPATNALADGHAACPRGDGLPDIIGVDPANYEGR